MIEAATRPPWIKRLTVAALCLLVFWAIHRVAWLEYDDAHRVFRVRPPAAVSGDEVHYLMVVNSLLFDHDLELGADYERVAKGGLEAGRNYSGVRLDHHTVLMDCDTGRRALWTDVFEWTRPVPPTVDNPMGFKRRTDDFPDLSRVVERSAHPLGFPVLAAAALVLTQPKPADVEAGVGLVNHVVAWLAMIIAYAVARRTGLRPRFAILAPAVLLLCSPWTAYARSYYVEPLMGLLLVAGLWVLLTERYELAALVVALAAVVKPPFILVGPVWFVALFLARERKAALRFGVALGVTMVTLCLLNYAYFRTWLAPGVAGWLWVSSPARLVRTFIEPRYGLLVYAPWVVAVAVFILRPRGASHGDREGLFIRAAAWPIAVFVVVLCLFGPLGGACYGPRYWVPLLPFFAILAAHAFAASRVAGRVVLGVLFAAALPTAIAGVLFYGQLWASTPVEGWTMLLDALRGS